MPSPVAMSVVLSDDERAHHSMSDDDTVTFRTVNAGVSLIDFPQSGVPDRAGNEQN